MLQQNRILFYGVVLWRAMCHDCVVFAVFFLSLEFKKITFTADIMTLGCFLQQSLQQQLWSVL